MTASVCGLTVSLTRGGTTTEVIRGVNLEIAPGEIVGLVGESGSGKSVLALALLGLLPESSAPRISGTITVAGVDMVGGSVAELRRVRTTELGAIFQDPMTSLNPTMRIGAQVTESTHSAVESIRLLSLVGIHDAAERMHSYPHELSGGLRQRVMAAIALSGTPSIIVADEPTTALDVTVQAQVLDLLRELRDSLGCSVLIITHDLGVAGQLADRIAVMYAGRIVEEGTTDQVLRHPANPYTVGLLGARLSLGMRREGLLATLSPEKASLEERMRGCAYHSRCRLASSECAIETPTLAPVESPSDAHVSACWRTQDEVRELAASGNDRAEEGLPHLITLAPAPASGGPAVEVVDLTCAFRSKGGRGRAKPIYAIQGISLRVERGAALSIVGESGSGKSTLLRVIAGLTPATSGSVTVGSGRPQMVFQDAGSSLTPWLTVGELLRERLLPLRIARIEADRRVESVLESMGLAASIARVRPSELSGGQRQRVVLARATIIPPSVLLCDEPTSALDASLAASVLNLIREMRERLRMTVLFVTHDLAVARLMGDRIAVMNRGRLVEIGDADNVISRPQDPYTAALIAAVPEIIRDSGGAA
jgi:peptide/nickel transport system ATP-binding protein